MNIYVLVEGKKGSKKIYKYWIPYLNPILSNIDYPNEFNNNNFLLVAGYGQPQFLNRVDNAVTDSNNIPKIDRLVIAVDSEDLEFDEKHDEIENRIRQIGCRVEYRIVIQHFCIETWLLGNETNFRRHPQDQRLKLFRNIFDIRTRDPELLPPHEENSWNRAQFAYYYLRAGIQDKYGGRKSYTKTRPGFTIEKSYFTRVKDRFKKKEHIKSFESFIDAFQ